jgi:hypothetical protein
VTDCAKPVITARGPEPHVSYSAISDWQGCGKYFQLKRMIGLPDRPAWWNVGGHAVHSATEAYDRQLYTAIGG